MKKKRGGGRSKDGWKWEVCDAEGLKWRGTSKNDGGKHKATN